MPFKNDGSKSPVSTSRMPPATTVAMVNGNRFRNGSAAADGGSAPVTSIAKPRPVTDDPLTYSGPSCAKVKGLDCNGYALKCGVRVTLVTGWLGVSTISP